VGVGVREATSGSSSRTKEWAAAYQKARAEILCQGGVPSLLCCHSCPFQRAKTPKLLFEWLNQKVIPSWSQKPSGSAGVGRSGFLVQEAGRLYGVEVEALKGVREGGPDVVASNSHGPR
jgi:hypothetical protein